MVALKYILFILGFSIVAGCTTPASREFNYKLGDVDKIHLYFRAPDGNMQIARIIQAEELYMLKKLLFKSRGKGSTVKFLVNARLEFFSGDSVIGQVSVNSGDRPLGRYSGITGGILYLSPKLGKLLQSWNETFLSELSLIEDCDSTLNKCSTNEHGWLNFESITVCEYLKLLKLKEIRPHQINILTTGNVADTTWIKEEDLEKLVKLSNSRIPAHCVMQAISSQLPFKNHATIGGIAIELINCYRFNQPYPIALTSCHKNIPAEREEILLWWEKRNP